MSSLQPQDEVKPGAPDWVVTFGDMMSLLLTFFVLLLSFSTMEAARFKMISGYMREAFGLQTEKNYTGIPMGTTILSTDARQTTDPADQINLVQVIRREMEKAGMDSRGKVKMSEAGVAIQLEGELVFDSGSSVLKPIALPLLDAIADIAKNQSGMLEVEGHTDDIPVSNSRYPSNWELSSARAGSAARYMIDRGMPPPRIKAVGYADTRPIEANTNSKNRSLNRRVEFLFVRPPEARDGGDPTPLRLDDAPAPSTAP
ncbi:MAG: OmpA family protein [bacterium]|nr:OmpA family protein [bacterium]